MLGCAAAVLGPPPVSSSARSSGASSSSWSSFFPGVVLGLVLGATPIAPLLVFTTDAHRGQRWRGLVAEEVHTSDLLASASELWTVQHRVELERADIDHVATAAAGVLAIETKWMSTWDPSWAERHLAQTRWGAGKIRSVMRSTVVGQPDVPVHAVLVVWGGALAQLGSDVREVDGVVVIPAAGLRRGPGRAPASGGSCGAPDREERRSRRRPVPGPSIPS